MPDSEAQFRETLCKLLESRRPQGYWTGWYVQIGNGIKRDGKTIQNWAEGRTLPSLYDGLALARWFALQGDLDFAQTLIGNFLSLHIGAGESAAEQKLAAVSGKVEELQAIIGGAVIPMRGRVS